MVTLRHPAFPKVTQEVEPECVAGWRAAGWLDERPTCRMCPTRESCDDGCDLDAPPDPAPEVKILPAPKPDQRYAKGGPVSPKPSPKRRAKTPSIGDD